MPGYIISLNGDTINGLIDYQNWAKNPQEISYKRALEGGETKYLPREIQSFGVSGEIYSSAIVDTEISPYLISELDDSAHLNIQSDTAFLQLMIRGTKSLYYYQNSMGMQNFYVLSDEGFELLKYKKYVKNQDNKRVIAENRRFVGQLSVHFRDCPKLNDALQKASYTKRSLEKVFLQYLSCSESEVSFQKKTEKSTTIFSAIAGITFNTFSFKGGNGGSLADIADVTFSNSTTPSFGLSFEVIFPRNRRRLSLVSELIYSSFQVEGADVLVLNMDNYINTYVKLDYAYTKLNLLLRYKYSLNAVGIYGNLGMSNGYAVTHNNFRRRETVSSGIGFVQESDPIANFSKYEQGLIIGTGVIYKKYSLEIRYEGGNGMVRISSLQSNVKRYSALIGYQF